MINRSEYKEVSQFVMTKEISEKVMYSMAAYYVDGLLIDTGPYSLTAEARSLFKVIPVEKVVNTHHHEDHIGNNYLFQDKCVPIFAHELAVPLIKEPSLWTSRLLDYQKLLLGFPPASNCRPLGDYIKSNKYRFRLIHTPGHSLDHICLLEEQNGWLFTGDLFLGEKVKIFRSDEDIHLSMASLAKLLHYDFDTIFCSSGRIFNHAKQRVKDKLNWWQDLYQQVIKMAEQGYDATNIRDELLGNENYFAQVTEGDMSKFNLIQSFLAIPNRE